MSVMEIWTRPCTKQQREVDRRMAPQWAEFFFFFFLEKVQMPWQHLFAMNIFPKFVQVIMNSFCANKCSHDRLFMLHKKCFTRFFPFLLQINILL